MSTLSTVRLAVPPLFSASSATVDSGAVCRFLSTMDVENINSEEILEELYDSSSDKEEEDYLEYEVEAEEEEYDSDADPEYLPDVEELGAIDELLEEDIREIEEDKTKKKKISSENTDSRKNAKEIRWETNLQRNLK
ncbi:hypothetical protein J6590_067328 [Homalodisca vitripennis]|nr:hypothetical protein J6590_067328 [Homalodisca vitripennis]